MPHFTSFDNARGMQQVHSNRNQSDRLTMSESLIGFNSTNQGIASVGVQGSGRFEIVNPYLTEELINPDGVNEALVKGLDVDSLIGMDVNSGGYSNDVLMANDQMLAAMSESMNGYIGGRHWTEFAESMYDIIDQYIGIGLEAYECASAGMTNAWNAKENQLCEGAGECNDFNNDGKIGNASVSDKCDGENTTLTDWILEKAAEAGDEALKLLGFDGDGDDEDSEADPDECFEKPWLYDQFNVMGDQSQFHDQGASDLISMNIFTQSQNTIVHEF